MSNYFVIDGLNVCKYQKRKTSLAILLTLVEELLNRGDDFICFFDGVTPHRLTIKDGPYYQQLLSRFPNYFIETTGGIEADDFILLKAEATGARIISNDRFRTYAVRFSWLQTSPERLVKGSEAGGSLMVPALEINVPVDGDLSTLLQSISEKIGSDEKTVVPTTMPPADLSQSDVRLGKEKEFTGFAPYGRPVEPLPINPNKDYEDVTTSVDDVEERRLFIRLEGSRDFQRVYYGDVFIGRNELRGAFPRKAVQALKGAGVHIVFAGGEVRLKPHAEVLILGDKHLIPGHEYPLHVGTQILKVGKVRLKVTLAETDMEGVS